MSDVPEAIGSAVAGAAVARAVEPNHGEAPVERGHFAERACLNCDTLLQGPYCTQCGQAAHLHRTLGGFLHDLLHGVLHLDGKIWRTLPMLAFRPGKLTRNYIEGHRARYVSPMALFLFSVFMIFAVFSLIGVSAPSDINPMATATEQADGVIADLEDQKQGLETALSFIPESESNRQEMEARIATVDANIAAAKALRDQIIETDGNGGFDFTVDGESSEFLNSLSDKWRQNPGLMLYKLQSNSYKFSWLLIPISVPLVWLIFAWRRRFGLYDHAVFVTYSIAFMSLFFILLSMAGAAGVSADILSILGTTIPIMHLYAHVKGTYELRKFSAAWRTVALLGIVLLAVIVFVISLALIGTFG